MKELANGRIKTRNFQNGAAFIPFFILKVKSIHYK